MVTSKECEKEYKQKPSHVACVVLVEAPVCLVNTNILVWSPRVKQVRLDYTCRVLDLCKMCSLSLSRLI